MMKRVHWNILTDCNLSCGFCYLWRREDAQVWQTAEAASLINALAGRVHEIVFGGGDPLMRQDLIELINLAKHNGLKVELHTNAELVNNFRTTQVFSLLDRLGLSLDGETAAVHDQMRSAPGNFAKTLQALAIAQELGLPTTVRTLLTLKNLGYVDGLGRMLSKFSCVKKWSIRQFFRRSLRVFREQATQTWRQATVAA